MPRTKAPDPEKYCEVCSKKLARKRFSSGALESLLHFSRRKYCNATCMGVSFAAKPQRSQSWEAYHYHARKLVPEGPCAACGKPDAIDVHHLDGNHTNNDPANLQRTCRSCHTKAHRGGKSCQICNKPSRRYGYCEMHAQRFKKWGDPTIIKDNQFVSPRKEDQKNPIRSCGFPTCLNPYHANGYCGMHAQRLRRGKLVLPAEG